MTQSKKTDQDLFGGTLKVTLYTRYTVQGLLSHENCNRYMCKVHCVRYTVKGTLGKVHCPLYNENCCKLKSGHDQGHMVHNVQNQLHQLQQGPASVGKKISSISGNPRNQVVSPKLSLR